MGKSLALPLLDLMIKRQTLMAGQFLLYSIESEKEKEMKINQNNLLYMFLYSLFLVCFISLILCLIFFDN